jgi:hypothetical protein
MICTTAFAMCESSKCGHALTGSVSFTFHCVYLSATKTRKLEGPDGPLNYAFGDIVSGQHR